MHAEHKSGYVTDDLRIKSMKVVVTPIALQKELPITARVSVTVHDARQQICDVLYGRDDRLLVVVGPCSIHDPRAAREYAHRLRPAMDDLAEELCIVMRVYFEKPRTTVGWKGLINDPYLDQTFNINDGVRQARHLLLDLAELGLPAGTEFLDPITPQYLAELSVGARLEPEQPKARSTGSSFPAFRARQVSRTALQETYRSALTR